MIIIGELLNSTRKKVRQAMADKDKAYIQELAQKQEAAGASHLDVNAGAFAEREPELLEWLIGVVREASNLPLCIDSPKPGALELGCRLAGENPIINSITAEEERFNRVVGIVTKYKAGVIALPLDDSGMTDDEEKILSIASRLVENLVKEGVAPEKIYLDPMIRPIGTNTDYGTRALDLVSRFKVTFPDANRVCGLSNISFGLPNRKLLNRAFLLMAMSRGLNAAILDPLDDVLMGHIKAAETLLGNDPYCMNYITAARSGALDKMP